MCRRNIRESLTARIFLLTLLLLLGAGGLTFGLIAWATPITYVSVVGDRLQVQVSELTDRLALTKLADAGPILDVFVRESGAAVSLASPDGESVDTGSLYVSVTTAVQESDSVSTYTYGADGGPAQRERAGHYVTTALSDALIAEVTYRGLTLDPDAVEVRLDGRVLEQLTAREFELLRELLSSPGRVFTREILLAKLWGYDFFGDERVVDSHIKNLRKKLGVDYIETVRGVGYRVPKEHP